MNGSSLIRWSSLEESRRRAAAGGVQAWPPWALSLLLGSMLAAEMARRLYSLSPDAVVPQTLAASNLWVAAAICSFSVCVFGAPFRLYWRRDSKLLASLPVPGQSLFRLALRRSQDVAVHICLALVVGLVPLGLFVDAELAARHLLLLALGFAGSAWLGPAAALAAGAIVASDKAQAMIASMSGEFQAPRTSWLGIMPGLAATAVAVAIMAAAPWTVGQRPPGGSIIGIALAALVLPALLLVWAQTRSASVIPAAIREVAALDQEILAHVERSTPSALERAFQRLTLSSSRARLLAAKDASMCRRRYPSPYFVIPCGIGALWVTAIVQPATYLPWAASIYGGLVVYALVMARRTWISPIEIPRLLCTLPLAPSEISRAKGSGAVLRILLIALLAGLPMILRAPQLSSAAILVGLSSTFALAFSLRSGR